jgi:homoserine O-succinyltransferase/O-acetyltransferase
VPVDAGWADTGVRAAGTGGRPLRCAFVNNMPDAALVSNEQQFVGLLEAGAGGRLLEVRRYGLSGIPRGPRTADYLRTEYLPLDQLWEGEPDALIVTGSEPLADSLADEPYWDEFVRLLEVAASRPTSVLLSCLSAHAALLALDGIDRSMLPAKCSGVFAHDLSAAGRPDGSAGPAGPGLTDGMEAPALMPHSRHNDVPTDAVAAAGWQVLMSSPVGWGAITARRSEADLLLVQGHPEYAPATLLREYRRDVGRYQRGERSVAPGLPSGCVAPGDGEAIEAFHRRVLAAGPGGADTAGLNVNLNVSFDFDAAGARATAPWRGMAETLYTNWIARIVARVAAGS